MNGGGPHDMTRWRPTDPRTLATGAIMALYTIFLNGVLAPRPAAAAEVIRHHVEAPPQELLDRCHEALKETRGVVMTLARFKVGAAELEWTGVGNVDARLWHPSAGGRHDVALVFGGVVGYQVPRVRPSTLSLAPGDLLVMVTDGIDPGFAAALDGGGPAQTVAERVFAAHGKGTDDALVVVVRYLPPQTL